MAYTNISRKERVCSTDAYSSKLVTELKQNSLSVQARQAVLNTEASRRSPLG